jgi:dipeptidyl aminopeptidase/acylaminoacyl peptidase
LNAKADLMMRNFSRPRFFVALGLLLAIGIVGPSNAFCQSAPGPRALDHSDYDLWNTSTDQRISNDGKWILYSVRSGKPGSSSTLNVRQNGATQEYAIQRASGAKFSYDSKYIMYRVSPDKDELEALKKAKVKSELMPGSVLEVLELKSGKKFVAEDVKSFLTPSENSQWIAYLLNKTPETKSAKKLTSKVNESYEVTEEGLRSPEKKLKLKKRQEENEASQIKQKKEAAIKPEAKKAADSKTSDKKSTKTKSAGTTLVLRDLNTGLQRTYPNVVSYSFSKNGARLAFVTSIETDSKASSAKSTTTKTSATPTIVAPSDGVTVVDLSNLKSTLILAGLGEYKNVAFNEDGSQLAFLSNQDDYSTKTSSWSVYHWKARQTSATKIAEESSDGIPTDWWISPTATATFSKDSKRIYFDTAPIPESVTKERTDAAAKKGDATVVAKPEKPQAKLDLWHWQDPTLQPQQLLQAEMERRRSYRATYNLRSKKVIQLATKDIPSVRIDSRSKSNLVVASSNMRYRKTLSWDIPGFQDSYLINLDTGKRETLVEKSKFSGSLSPEGKYVVWFDAEEKKWYSISTGTNREPVEISAGLEHPLQNELHDTPSLPRAYGSAGWLPDDEAFLIYDRFDIWQLDPTAEKPPVCLTQNEGRENSIRFRYLRMDSELRHVDVEAPIYLSAFNEVTKSSGFYRLDMRPAKTKSVAKPKTSDESEATSQPTLKRLIMLDERISRLAKAKQSDEVIFNRSTFQQSPDVWSSTTDFKKISRISDINPQQENYLWGSSELVHWDATDGQKLDGILYKPDGFDPAKKYPMMVYFYERNSDNLHAYYTPAAGRSIINHSFYVSRGYVVFVPDIPYKTGEPGPSAVNAILPGVQSILDLGFVDAKKVGMQGHSWGGYQTAYLVTQTDMFACAESGAPVSNMTSAYGGIRWSSGMSRMFQYERTQSRIGQDLWAAREKYILNSPVFFADKVNTPLLILHNDEDGAVPWYQGIELFVALRRLEQPAWLLNYNGQPHWVMKDENRLDFAIRMQQFFDHYLMDAPEPEWMAYGIPGVDKGKKFGLELLEPKKSATENAEEPAKN